MMTGHDRYSRHAGLDPASIGFEKHWIPAQAGMTGRDSGES
ncbi:MAG: hypothetical protein RQ867_04275 [Mariprofundaceae bacterium]|nr:hypothetical protein [Mariprofundaceae bacterium]